MPKFFHAPFGDPSSHSRPWVAFRVTVREAAGRFCDRATHETTGIGVDAVELLVSCGDCAACEAREFIAKGLA